MKKYSVEEFLEKGLPIIDVRSPNEYNKGHIPYSHNLPLFTDEERVEVGTTYKKKGKEEAIHLGLEIVGPKLRILVQNALLITDGRKQVCIHCFRGGMRSQSVAWLLELAGWEVFLLEGGYKAFRSWILERFSVSYPFVVLGGLTGSGKTEILASLADQGESVIDLEGHARHKGSAFGGLGQEEQPSQPHFENLVGIDLWKKRHNKCIWIEDESRAVGKNMIPEGIWNQMRSAIVLFVERSIEERVHHLSIGYGGFSIEELQQSAERIRKRFGPDRTQELLLCISEGRIEEAIAMVLLYYDKGYQYGLSKRDNQKTIFLSVQGHTHQSAAQKIRKWRDSVHV